MIQWYQTQAILYLLGEHLWHPTAGSVALADNGQWTKRFEIKSETSNRLYIIACNKKTGKWGCSCPGYLRHRKCKHLMTGCGLSLNQIHGNNQLPDQKPSQKAIGHAKKK